MVTVRPSAVERTGEDQRVMLIVREAFHHFQPKSHHRALPDVAREIGVLVLI